MFLAFVLGPDRTALKEVVDFLAMDEGALHVLQGLDDQSFGTGWTDLVAKG